MQARRIALIIAIANYNDARLNKLQAPEADAEALREVLSDAKIGHFDEVEVLADASIDRAFRAIEGVLVNRQAEDTVLIHFSGHGLKDVAGELYLATSNTVRDLLASTAIE